MDVELTTQPVVYVVLDTNVVLHYTFENCDWKAVIKEQLSIKAKDVRVVLGPILIRETQQKKDIGETKALRARAKTVLSLIERWQVDEGSGLPAHTRADVRFRWKEADFGAHNLDSSVADDHVIANIQWDVDQGCDAPIVLAAKDTGLRLAARSFGITLLDIPEKYHLPDPPDKALAEAQRKNQDLEEELKRLQDAQPHLVLTFSKAWDGHAGRGWVTISRSDALDEAELGRRMASARSRLPKQSVQTSNLGHYADPFMAEKITYNSELERYFIALEEHERLLMDYGMRTDTVAFKIGNEGNGPATDIDISLEIANGILVLDSLGGIFHHHQLCRSFVGFWVCGKELNLSIVHCNCHGLIRTQL